MLQVYTMKIHVFIPILLLINLLQQVWSADLNTQNQIILKAQNQFKQQIRFPISKLNYSEDKNLIIQLTSKFEDQYFDISINVTKDTIGIVGLCNGVRHVLCMLDARKVGKDGQILIQVASLGAGQYYLRGYWDKVSQLTKGVQTINMEGVGKCFKLSLKQQIELSQSIRVVLTPPNENFYSKIYAKKQLSSADQFESITMWQGIQGFFLTKPEYASIKQIYTCMIGQPKSSYKLQLQVLVKDHHDVEIPEIIDQFIGRNQDKKYHIKLQTKLQKEQIIINFQIFSGNPQIAFYTDATHVKQFKAKYFQYMADSRFVFTQEELNDTKDIYFKARSSDHHSVFRFQVKRIKVQNAQQLVPNSYNFHAVSKSKFLYLYLNPSENQVDFHINVTMTVLFVLGNSNIEARVGSINSLACLPDCYQKQFKAISELSTTPVALKVVHRLSIKASNLSQSSILLLKLKRKNKKKLMQQVSIEYNFEGKMTNLRQNYPLTEIVERTKLKYYKFTPLQFSKNVKICASLISGSIGFLGSYVDPLKQQSSSITAVSGCVQFSYQTIKRSVYVSVYGSSRSKFTLSVQIGHKQEIAVNPVLQTNEDVEYQVVLAPQTSQIFILHPIYQHLRINYNNSIPLKVCLINQGNGSSMVCDSEFTRENEISGQLYDKLSKSRIRKFMITNPSSKQPGRARMKYHSGDYEHCEAKLLNRIYQQYLTIKSCFEFELTSSNQSYQIITKQMYNRPQNLTVGVCGKQIIKLTTERVIQVSSKKIQDNCPNNTIPTLSIIAEVDPKLETAYIIQYIVQTKSDFILLPANLRFTDRAVIGEVGPLRQFALQTDLQNDGNILIFIRQRTTAVLIRASVYITQKTNIIGSTTYQKIDPIFVKQMQEDLELAIFVMSVDAQKSCDSYLKQVKNQCEIILVLEPIQRKHVGEELQYSIQFKSKSNQIREFQPETSEVSPGSSQIYTFYPHLDQPKQANYSAVLRISTQNQQCFRIFVNRFDDTNKQKSLINSTSNLNIFEIDSSAYLIQVQAEAEHCSYYLEINLLTSDKKLNSIPTLHAGFTSDFNIAKDEVKYFILDTAVGKNKSALKVYYLRKYGDIRMYATDFDNKLEQKILNNNTYKFVSTDFLYHEQFPNILELMGINSDICILAVQGQSDSQGSLLLQSEQQTLVLPNSKKLLNSLLPEKWTSLKYYTPKTKIKSGTIQIELIFGDIKVKASFVSKSDKMEEIRNKLNIRQDECCNIGKTNAIPFKFEGDGHVEYLQIKIANQNDKQPAIFEVSIKLDDNQVSTEDIDKDVLTHVQIAKDQITKIKTRVSQKIHKVILSLPDAQLQNKPQNKKEAPNKLNQQLRNKTQDLQKNSSNQTKKDSQNESVSNPQTEKTAAQASQTSPPPTGLSCLKVNISQSLKEYFKMKTTNNILNNILMIEVQWVKYKFSFNRLSEDLILNVFLQQDCDTDQLVVSVAADLEDRLTIMTPFRWFYVSGDRELAIPSNKEFLIDIISCSGASSLKMAKSFSALYNENQTHQNITSVASQPHIFRITPTQSLTYLKIESREATIRLLIPDHEKQIGVGYLKYQWNYFLYETDFKKLTLYLQPVKKISETKTQIVKQEYYVRIVGGINLVEASAQCVQVGQRTIYKGSYIGEIGKALEVVLSKQQLLQSLNGKPEDLYVQVTYVMVLKTPDNKLQAYKFLSPPQQIPTDIFNITKLSNKIIAFGILTILLAIFGCLILAQLFLKYVVPFLGRIKRNNQLVEEENAPPQIPLQSLPASSDRNERASTDINSDRRPATATEQQMKNEVKS